MNDTIEYDIGSDVVCSDGDCGELTRVVVDPIAVAITHLVVTPKHHHGIGHLVPIALATASHGEIQLRCTISEFQLLDDAEETHLLSGANGPWRYEQAQMLSLPYYSLAGGMGMGGVYGAMGSPLLDVNPHEITSDRVPDGEVDVRRGDPVHATDGEIGRVQGMAIDPRDHHVTHILLDEGHLWGQKRVAIPIRAVTKIGDDARLTLTKNEVRDLPEVELAHPG